MFLKIVYLDFLIYRYKNKILYLCVNYQYKMPDINKILRDLKVKESFKNQKTDSDRFNEMLRQDSMDKQNRSTIPDLTQELPKDSIQREIELNNRAAEKFDPLTKLVAQEQNIDVEHRAEYSPSVANDGFIKKNQDLITIGFIIISFFLLYRFFKKRQS
jgi:hypothetical protein